MITYVCQQDNDLYKVLTAAGLAGKRYNDAATAIKAAEPQTGILILADQYPAVPTVANREVFSEAARKELRLYIEFPAELPDLPKPESPRQNILERVIVQTDSFGKTLPSGQIITIHDCHFLPYTNQDPLLVIAKAAGFDHAVYGLNDTESHPILFEHPRGNMLVSTTKLSQFVTARYAPKSAFQSIWKYILGFLKPEMDIPELEWTPTVRPSYADNEALPAGARKSAVIRGIEWHTKARLLIHPSWLPEYEKRLEGHHNLNGVVAPLPDAHYPVGDGSCGILEGISSRIDYQGRQMAACWLRSDCNGESSLAFALRSALDGDQQSREIAANLLDWVYDKSGIFEKDPESPYYGLLRWAPDNTRSYYQDNDIKAILGCIGTAELLKTNRWDEPLVKNILANFRTTGCYGFRGSLLYREGLEANGWEYYWRAETIKYHPHFEVWSWAAYLWLYDKTHFTPLLTRTRKAIQMMMEAYPEKWRWTNGFQQERARMLLPLTWLVRVDDQPEHRAWLKQIADDLELYQEPCGALREELGPPSQGTFGPPATNAEYGTTEAALIHENGDPVADLLYTCNFAFFGLNEALAATGEKQYKQLADRLEEFLLRIQVRSEAHPELDGGWFRAFDYHLWDYFGSNADSGWGAWCMETGWTQGWITSTLALRELNTSLWDLSCSSRIEECFSSIRHEMLPDEILT